MATKINPISVQDIEASVSVNTGTAARDEAQAIMSNLIDPQAVADLEFGGVREPGNGWFERVVDLMNEQEKQMKQAQKLLAKQADTKPAVAGEFARQAINSHLENLNGSGEFIPNALDGAKIVLDEQGELQVVTKTRKVSTGGSSQPRGPQMVSMDVTHPDSTVQTFDGGQVGLVEYVNQYATEAGYDLDFESKLWSRASKTSKMPKNGRCYMNEDGTYTPVLIRYKKENDPIRKVAEHHGHSLTFRDAEGNVL